MMQLFALLLVSVSLLVGFPAGAANEAAKKVPEFTKEERAQRGDMMEKMAEMHKRMAQCLHSDRPMSECHDQMINDCPMAKDGHCPMMDEMCGMRGGMHHHGSRTTKKENEKKK